MATQILLSKLEVYYRIFERETYTFICITKKEPSRHAQWKALLDFVDPDGTITEGLDT